MRGTVSRTTFLTRPRRELPAERVTKRLGARLGWSDRVNLGRVLRFVPSRPIGGGERKRTTTIIKGLEAWLVADVQDLAQAKWMEWTEQRSGKNRARRCCRRVP